MSGKAKNKELMLPTVRLLYHPAKLSDFQYALSYFQQETIVPAVFGIESPVTATSCLK